MTVATGSVEIKESYSASIQGRQDIDIYPQVSGRIVKLCITEGQQVHKGQLLFIIDQVPYQAAWQKAKADVRAAEAQAKTARLEWESKKQLFSKQVVSEYDLTTAQNALDMAEATLEQMKALELNARNNLSYTEVRSPADGVTGTLPYREGTLVSSSMSTPLTTISDNSEMYVYFSMTENSLRALFRQYGSSDGIIRQMPPLSLMLNDGTLYTCHGRIESISGVINRQTGTVSVRSAFPNPDRLLLSGGIGNIILPHKEAQAIVIPQTATTELQDKILAYKVATDAHSGKATVTSVELTVEKLNDGKTYIVRSGLNAGDVIVTEGAGLLRDGMQIKVKNSKTGKEN
ncbi:efflux RND transporter periplasmic adaptor subunit [Bacteroides sp. AF20-13LB]|uniref:efflux RND transporter periplasmic adaptor subunit n=1 Tax=Bacteroides sp. AF20-13LB TaxID=2292921 RepID=UPI000E745457|nr:efflux RND transporter periplasmic adaptor subunit [Bacteroides sp. AF20-13LB]RJV38939.1 efflux RND transporter periplasmic adaptor subunit [Bacteroides sp. AF20-13LB]